MSLRSSEISNTTLRAVRGPVCLIWEEPRVAGGANQFPAC